jgi:hypothetical protein
MLLESWRKMWRRQGSNRVGLRRPISTYLCCTTRSNPRRGVCRKTWKMESHIYRRWKQATYGSATHGRPKTSTNMTRPQRHTVCGQPQIQGSQTGPYRRTLTTLHNEPGLARDAFFTGGQAHKMDCLGSKKGIEVANRQGNCYNWPRKNNPHVDRSHHDQLTFLLSRSFFAFSMCPVNSVYAISQSLKRITPNPSRPNKYDARVISTQNGRTGMISSWTFSGRTDGILVDFSVENP